MRAATTSTLLFSGLAAATACYADVITTFDVSATLETGTLVGTITIDITTLSIISADVAAPGTPLADFSIPDAVVPNYESTPDTVIALLNSPFIPPTPSDLLVLQIPTGLSGYAGGPLCYIPVSDFCLGYASYINLPFSSFFSTVHQ
jgi:hypothetical protein